MLEDFSGMEKKPNGRTLAPLTKSGAEVKCADANTSKPFGKCNRKREPASNATKNDPLRKSNNPSKVGKFPDKRPRHRSQYYGGGKAETKVDLGDGGPEYGSVFNPGTKKQNLNHLLKFTLAPRASGGNGSSASAHARERPGYWLATHKHKYNKEQFLQANCQFVVKSGVDYSPYLLDPDILVDWDLIEQVRFRSTEDVSCPICLDTPAAAKMTRCGHVYCWPCILHYLALSDKTWRKCPICYEAVHRKDLKSVVVVSNTPSRVGEEYSFRLMKRERNSLTAIPVSEDDDHRQIGIPLSVNEPVRSISFSKLLLASLVEVEAMLHLESDELNEMRRAAEGEPEVCFVEQAIELLEERVRGEVVHNAGDVKVDRKVASPENVLVVKEREREEDGALAEAVARSLSLEQTHSDDEDPSFQNVSPEDVETEGQVSGQKPFYFYQAMDGQNVFLTALNLRMLETEYGGLQYCPITITGRVMEKEAGSMTRELRSRLRSLSHLPVTAAFELLELDMRPMVSPEVLNAFAAPLTARAERRQRRDRQERRREKRITNEVAIKWGQRPAPRIRLDSAKHFPRCGEEDITGEEQIMAGVASLDDSLSQSMNSLSSAGIEPELSERKASPSESAGPSFAQMLKAGATSVRARPAWPSRAAESVFEEVDPEAPPRSSFNCSDIIAKALERADLNLDEDDNSSKKKNKKKRKQKVVFVSGLAFVGK